MRIGLVVNPDAGLGGRLGYKGSDGLAETARAAGAVDCSGPRVAAAMLRLAELVEQRPLSEALTIIAWAGRMGETWLGQTLSQSTTAEPAWEVELVGEIGESTSAEDTAAAVKKLVKCDLDLLVYGGGDGTTRDIVAALAEAEAGELPIVGIPGGVKMHSGCFATTPRAGAEVIRAFLDGDLLPGRTEVMDLDEEVYRQGEWRVRMYGEAMTPSSPRWMQGAKEQVMAADESETIAALAEHINTLIEANPELMVIWGSGGTLREIARLCGYETTLLGIDISCAEWPASLEADLNEAQLLEIIGRHEGEKLLLLSPMGGQGFLIGRGNLQLSPEVLRVVGLDNILGVVTPAKLLALEKIRIDTGDPDLDNEFQQRKYVKLLQGFRTTRIMRIESD
jgi:predicted polyphosphate/ATP-dependent NAD kinase